MRGTLGRMDGWGDRAEQETFLVFPSMLGGREAGVRPTLEFWVAQQSRLARGRAGPAGS